MSWVVYLLDDNEAVRESVAAILGLHDITVHTYESAEIFQSLHFDEPRACLLIDIHLGDGNGIETLSALRKRGVQLPAILMSGRVQAQEPAEFEGLEPVVFLEKPIDGDAIAAMLEDMLNDGER